MEIRSNVLNKKITTSLIKDTLVDISDNLANSLGPYGSTTIMEDKVLNHVISKDGYTILNKLMYDNEVSQTVLDIIKKISRSLVREVGDGSTSSIIIASKLYLEIIDELLSKENISPKVVIKVLKALEVILEREIRANAVPITSENFNKIEEIATVSNNNDNKLGKLIADLYKEIGVDGFITLENSKTSEDYYEIKDGYEISRGYIDTVFVNALNKIDFEGEKAFVFIANDTLREEDMEYLRDLIGKVTGQLRRPLVIVAKDYDIEVVNFLKINKIQNRELNLVAVDFSLAKQSNRDALEDFAVYVGATIYDKYGMNQPDVVDLNILGQVNKVIVTEKFSRFVGGKGTEEEVQGRLKLLEEQLETTKQQDESRDMSDAIFALQKRISLLSSRIATFYVGGNSEIEKENRKFLLEDSIFACQSTIRNGYIIGGNLIIPLILKNKSKELKEELYDILKNDNIDMNFIDDVISCVYNSFLNGFRTVLRNYKNDDNYINNTIDTCINNEEIYNLVNHKYETKDNTSIINSASTDIEIMKATFSIIGLLATSNQFVSRSIIRDAFYVNSKL